MSGKSNMALRILFIATALPLALSAVAARAGETQNGNLALCVGINGYSHLTPLAHSVDDAYRLADVFEETGDFRRIITLADVDRDGEPAKPRLTPTRSNILDLLRLISNNATHSDGLIFAFSGHGMTHDGKHYLMPLDAEPQAAIDADAGIPLTEIVDIMAKSRAGRKLLLLDANHESEFFQGLIGPVSVPDEFTAIVSTSEGQFSLVDAEKRGGLFCLGIEAALSGEADANGDKAFSGGEIAEFLSMYLSNHCLDNLITTGQSPQLSGDSDAIVIEGYGEVGKKESLADTGASDSAAAVEPETSTTASTTITTPSTTTYVEPYTSGTTYTTSSGTTYYVEPQESSGSTTTYSQPRQSSSNAGRRVGKTLRWLLTPF